MAWFPVRSLTQFLRQLHLNLQMSKTQNLLLRPLISSQGVHRRGARAIAPASKKRLRDQQALEAQHSNLVRDAVLEFDPMENDEDPRGCTDKQNLFPTPLTEDVKILGITFDRHCVFDTHIEGLISKECLRQGVLARVSHTTWGLETSILKATYDAVISSLIRYGLLILGSCLPEDLANRLDVQVINTAARRISRLPMTTRVETLHFISGPHSFRNLYVIHCAQFAHSALSSHGSPTQARIKREICAIYDIPAVELGLEELKFNPFDTFWREQGSLPP